MATRKTEAPEFDLIGLFVKLVEFNPTKEEPVSVQEMDSETGESTFQALGALADAELIEFERGNVWLNVPDVSAENAADTAREALSGTIVVETPKPKRTRRTKAQMEEDKIAERERLEYSTSVAASQEPGSQHLHPMEDARPIESQSPDYTDGALADLAVMSNGEPPQDASDPKQNGTVVGEDDMMEVAARIAKRAQEIHATADSIVVNMAPEMWTPSYEEAKNEPYEGPESIPAVPDGVRNNTWFMAHYADTETARSWWMRKAQEQSAAHEATVAEALGNADVAPF